MTKEEHTKLLDEIRTTSDDATRSSLLLQLQSDYDNTLETISNLTENIETVSAERDRYAKANNDLWLQVNATRGVNTEVSTPEHTEEPPTKRSFDDLDFSE